MQYGEVTSVIIINWSIQYYMARMVASSKLLQITKKNLKNSVKQRGPS